MGGNSGRKAKLSRSRPPRRALDQNWEYLEYAECLFRRQNADTADLWNIEQWDSVRDKWVLLKLGHPFRIKPVILGITLTAAQVVKRKKTLVEASVVTPQVQGSSRRKSPKKSVRRKTNLFR